MTTSTHTQQGQPWCGFTPRRWQAEALPVALEALAAGKSGVIRAATGAGKTALQSELIARVVDGLTDPDARVLVTVPTQDLVRQFAATLERRLPGRVGRYYQHAKSLEHPVVVTCHASIGSSHLECPECSGAELGASVREVTGADAEMARSIWELGKASGLAVGHGCMRPEEHTRVVEVLEGSSFTRSMRELGLRVDTWMSDECHKSNADAFTVMTSWLEPARRIGFTATPFRSSEHEVLTHFDELLYDYGPSDAMRDGVVMMPRVRSWQGPITPGDSAEIDEVCAKMIEQVLAEAQGPGVVNAVSCDGADSYASFLRARGLAAASIHSKLDRETQAKRLEGLRAGRLDCLVHVNMLSEGVDLPWLEWLCMRRESMSRVRFVQEVGRVVRTFPGKTRALVLDPLDHFGSLALDYEAMLGGEDDASAVDELADEIAKLLAGPQEKSSGGGGGSGKDKVRAKALGEVRSWVRQRAFEARCLGRQRLADAGGARDLPASSKQCEALRLLCARPDFKPTVQGALTEAQLVVMREAYRTAMAGMWTRGDVWDLLTIVHELMASGRLPVVGEEVRHAA